MQHATILSPKYGFSTDNYCNEPMFPLVPITRDFIPKLALLPASCDNALIWPACNRAADVHDALHALSLPICDMFLVQECFLPFLTSFFLQHPSIVLDINCQATSIGRDQLTVEGRYTYLLESEYSLTRSSATNQSHISRP
jgi:hypothetical protein